MKKFVLLLIIGCLTLPMQADNFFYTDYEWDSDPWKLESADYPDFAVTEYNGTIMRIGVVGENTIVSWIGSRAEGTTNNQICAAVVIKNNRAAGPAVSINLDDFRVGVDRRNQGKVTLESCVGAQISANILNFGCAEQGNAGRLCYGKLEVNDGGGTGGGSLDLNVAGEIRFGRTLLDGYNEGDGAEFIVSGGAEVNITAGGNTYVGVQYGLTSSANQDVGTNGYWDFSASGSASVDVTGDMYIGTGRGAGAAVTFNASADLEFSVSRSLVVGGQGYGSRADGEGHLTVSGKAGLSVTATNVRTRELIVGSDADAVCTVTASAGAHVAVLNAASITVGSDDTITLDYTGSSQTETWLRTPIADSATLVAMVGSGQIAASGTSPGGTFGVYDVDDYSYVCYGAVPEPATLSLLALGGLAALIRRKR